MGGEKTMHLVSLGCAKNLVDSEVMLAVLEEAGYAVVEDPEQAELLLVNTCGFIQPAVEEAVDHILRLAEYKQHNRNAILVVCGCLVQRYGDELLQELPEVDLFVGINEIADIADLIDRKKGADKPVLHLQPPGFLMKSSTPRRLSTPFFQAYLKITEGCDNRCTYCLIPSIRGDLRSRSIADLVCEAQRLEQGGVRELCLIAQDLTAYGNDLPGDVSLTLLLEQLLRETAIPWFRLLYLYPTNTGDDLLSLMAREARIVPYLDIPFQHVSDHILHAMNRRYTLADLDRLVADIRRYLLECALRSTLLVGFPGETEKDVSLLIDCLERWHLDHVGVFQYQDELGCSAHRLADKVGREEKAERYDRVMKVQAGISADNIKRFVGRVEPVLVEGVSSETELLLEGRTRFQAPDIDGCVYIAAGRANPGDIVSVRITDAHTYDLVGEIIRQ
ncbi:MAG TPA: 30S ribosomal protein S12 methylthiotransferase RimO [Desulfobulbus sp.]|nr:30S ribosomal protein S12 methylthiotransferase RimO [Desulfobulbus sp.]